MICHVVAVVLTLVQTKQVRINVPKSNNTKNTVQTIQNTVNIRTHIAKTPTSYSVREVDVKNHNSERYIEREREREREKRRQR